MYLIVIILSLFIAFNSIGNIPSGNEMGAIGQAIMSLLITFFILLIGYFVSIYIEKYGLKITTYVIILLSVYYFTDRICVTEPFIPTPKKEIRAENQKNEEIDNKKVKKIIGKIDLNLKSPEYAKMYEKLILSKAKELLSQGYNAKNENIEIKNSIARFLNWFEFPSYEQDSSHYNWSINYVKDVEKSLKCKLLYFSPNQEIFLAFLTFNYSPYDESIIGTSANCFVYLCYFKNNDISIYPYFQYPSVSDDFPNENIAFNHVIRYLNNDYGEEYFEYKLSYKKFWVTRQFKKFDYEANNYYGFQLKFYQPKGSWDKISKDSIIAINEPIFKTSRS